MGGGTASGTRVAIPISGIVTSPNNNAHHSNALSVTFGDIGYYARTVLRLCHFDHS
jgi:hypothetical protein